MWCKVMAALLLAGMVAFGIGVCQGTALFAGWFFESEKIQNANGVELIGVGLWILFMVGGVVTLVSCGTYTAWKGLTKKCEAHWSKE